jgi:predicted DNA-binding antitoxin AbrB/MazE fold protein
VSEYGLYVTYGQRVITMVRTIRARFSRGVFEPLESDVARALKEGEEVLITLSTPGGADAPDSLAESVGGWKG